MNPLARKKPAVRLFTGLVGIPTEEIPKPDSESITSTPIEPGPRLVGRDSPEQTATTSPVVTPQLPSPETIADLEKQILTAKKRGRPRIHANDAEKMRRHRKTKTEREDQAAAERDFQNKIDKILWENRDSAGRLHGETSGGDALFVAERVNRREWVNIDGEHHAKSGGRVSLHGTDGIAFEKGVGPGRGQKDEKVSTWANRQNFFQGAHWDANEKKEFLDWMSEIILTFDDVEGDEEKQILRCGMCPYQITIDKDFREKLNNIGYSYHDLPRNHLFYQHKKFVKDMIQEHEPHPPELQKKPKECTEQDHKRFAEIFADQLPASCRHCKKLITGIS
jgi:hypothetical protein